MGGDFESVVVPFKPDTQVSDQIAKIAFSNAIDENEELSEEERKMKSFNADAAAKTFSLALQLQM
ncbi:MAG: hypothetical protein GC136_08265 [Alphaproteobacteria bacterium]|nr:hypothetical protein [Alphaproteobacteria bacterium]